MAVDRPSCAEDPAHRPASDVQALVSIGLPVLDGGPLLARALGDLRAQTWTNLEIIVSDNGSTDETPIVIEDAVRSDSRVRAVRRVPPASQADNFAHVLELATGEYFLWAAHDDRWPADYVERLVGRLEAEPAAVLAAGVPWVVDEAGDVLATYPEVSALAAPDRCTRLTRYIATPEPLGKANLIYGVFRRTPLQTLGLRAFWAADPRRTDYHAVFAVLARGPVVIDPDVRFYKLPPADHARRGWTGPLQSLLTIYRWLDAYLNVADDLGLSYAELSRVQAAVRRRKLGLPWSRFGRRSRRW